MCKVNCVHTVNRMLSPKQAAALPCSAPNLIRVAVHAAACSQKELDISLYSHIIIFTSDARSAENQTILPAPAGHAEPPSRNSAAREFSGPRVLRSARPGASKVRDAPASRG